MEWKKFIPERVNVLVFIANGFLVDRPNVDTFCPIYKKRKYSVCYQIDCQTNILNESISYPVSVNLSCIPKLVNDVGKEFATAGRLMV